MIEGTPSCAEAFAHFSSGPYDSVAEFITAFLSERSYIDPKMFTFVILSKSDAHSHEVLDGVEVAGMVSLTNADAQSRRANIGLLQILPQYQNQGIATKAGSLLLKYGLSSPEKGGLGLVRMEWHSSTQNEASLKVARRLGFQETATIEYEKCLQNGVARGKIGNGKPQPPGTAAGDLWRDIVIFSMTWKGWAA